MFQGLTVERNYFHCLVFTCDEGTLFSTGLIGNAQKVIQRSKLCGTEILGSVCYGKRPSNVWIYLQSFSPKGNNLKETLHCPFILIFLD